MWEFVLAEGLSFKKPSRPANESVQWRRYQARMDASRLVFIDETWTKTKYGPASLVTTRLSAAHPPAVRQVEYEVAEILAPTLRQGDLVMMDNLGSHKGPAIRRIIRAAGAKPFLLPSIPQISTRSSRSSPNSSTCSERPPPRTQRRSAPLSASCSVPTPPTNAQVASRTQVTTQANLIML